MDEVDEMVELYEKGWTQREIGKKYDIHQSAVSRKLRDRGVKGKRNGGRKKIPKEVVDEWAELYEEGKTQQEIADKFGVSQMAVSNRLRDRGLTTGKGGNISEEMVDEWVDLYERGNTQKEIAEEYGVGASTVSKRLKKRGVDTRHEADYRRIPDRTVDEWVELYEKGLNTEEIAEEYDVTAVTVSNKLKQRGVETRGRSKNIEEDILRKWIELYEQGNTMKQIADEYGVARGTVSSRLRMEGVETRGRGEKFSEETVDEWVDLYENGMSKKRIAKKYGASLPTVHISLKKRGVGDDE